jgi:hypothetical protein
VKKKEEKAVEWLKKKKKQKAIEKSPDPLALRKSRDGVRWFPTDGSNTFWKDNRV